MGDETVSSNGEPGTEEAEALASALNHSAERVQTLWFIFLTFMLYLAIATGTTTHRMLFLQSPLNLPVLNLVLLARTARSFEDALAHAFPEDGEPRENFRMRSENTLFVQLLVGGRLERHGINAKLLSWMALITLALAPAALMLFLEIKFLPYHSEWITWLHRGLLALDLALVWTLWPGYRSGWGVRLWPRRSWWLALPGVLSLVALANAVAVATFPDERMYLATNWLHESRAGAKIAPVNTLDLHGEDLIDDAKLKQIIEKNESSSGAQRWVASLSLAGRDLTGAELEGADVRHVDFSDAILNRANLDDAWAANAHFYGAQLHGASLDRAQLQGASLDRAQLQGASLQEAQLQGAYLGGVLLQGASFDAAQLQGASFDAAQLQGASLEQVLLQGASFVGVCAWRADARNAIWEDTRVVAPKTGAKDESADKKRDCNWTTASFEKLKKLIAEQVPVFDHPDEPLGIIEHTLDPTKALEEEDEMAKVWAAQASTSPARDVYEKSLAEQWHETACAAEGAPYVLRALLRRLDPRGNSPFAEDSPERPKLAAAFLAKDCAGAHGLSEADIAKLEAIRDRGPSPAPKP